MSDSDRVLAALQDELALNARARARLFLDHGGENEEYRELEARAVELRASIRALTPARSWDD